LSKLRIFHRLPSVVAITGYGKSTVWEKSSDPNDDFPAPVRIAPKVSAWLEDELIEWQNRRIAERDARIAERDAAQPRPRKTKATTSTEAVS
jgi:prophage regulatory protein